MAFAACRCLWQWLVVLKMGGIFLSLGWLVDCMFLPLTFHDGNSHSKLNGGGEGGIPFFVTFRNALSGRLIKCWEFLFLARPIVVLSYFHGTNFRNGGNCFVICICFQFTTNTFTRCHIKFTHTYRPFTQGVP